ncbi:MAG: hypothetical protein CL760_06465 [Chloroflexi bacterium]|nr:hypothetical protein [Chloroflexota bacterium]|tara:strand:+ start:4598 stop:5227 length:630 start_codon:yes stop_codon:yes gene_type:complete
MNLSKEIKQDIAFNYMLKKVGDLDSRYTDISNSTFFSIRDLFLESKNLSLNDLQTFYDKVKTLSPKFVELFVNNGLSNSCYTYNDTVRPDKHKNKIIFHKIQSDIYKKESFDYQIEAFPLINITGYDSFINGNEKCKEVIEKHNNQLKDLQEECQTHYDNLYELIRNVRTLDRIRKNFPEVDLYLPEKYFKTVEDKKKEESLHEKFAKL